VRFCGPISLGFRGMSLPLTPFSYHLPSCSSSTSTRTCAPSSNENFPYFSAPPHQTNHSLMTHTPQSAAQFLPTKTRRPRSTEKERINQLRADPYVAQYEASRVLCALCNQWVKLKLHSKYHLARWEEHRKICSVPKEYVTLSLFPTSMIVYFCSLSLSSFLLLSSIDQTC
jgi:hypothetical protein